MFGRGALRQLADDRQRVGLLMAGFDDHEYPEDQDQGVEQLVDAEHVGDFAENRREYPFHDEPRHKKVKALKGVETDAAVVAEFMRGQHDD